MKTRFEQQIQSLVDLFSSCKDTEAKYNLLIEMGRKLPPLSSQHKVSENRIDGCQSTLYLHTFKQNHLLCFEAEADALISAGLAALLHYAYDHQPLELIISSSPAFLNQIGISTILSPHRVNGLYHIYRRIQQDAIKLFVQQQKEDVSDLSSKSSL